VAEAVFDQEFVKVKTPATLRNFFLPARWWRTDSECFDFLGI
jgi:hypothetical protein